MPNWCYNHIEISGSEENFNKFKEKFESLNESKTIMTDLIGLGDNVPEDYHDQGQYGHNIGRFGTKWDFGYSDATITINDRTIEIDVDTAWSPPVNFLIEMCVQHKVSAHIFYEEPGMDFAGTIDIADDGYITNQEDYTVNEWNYISNKELFWENVENEVEYVIENIENVDDYLEQYPYVEVEDLPKLKEIFENFKK